MATAYDNWKTRNDAIDSREEARDEFIAERTKELTAERLADEDRVADAISEFIGYEDDGERLLKSLARFRAAFDIAQTDCGMAEAGLPLFRELSAVATSRIRRDAESDASSEADKHFPEYDDRDPEGLQERAA
ncbi:hypothetical protein ARC78_14970 [Stenotrophomonas pictorum JCM 9942]|uniref:Uncharacterized protein n=1 Tax=Stenotrophomonas pictorum JCM 9942 TaxID=1236960 RepID=A0A0R0AB56_9GAMM|nr:hypothetical protein [Stenotrophomonas pictorum]KRG39118.1 hypothetical protein ARC78_14970 [Stenotrophomonas pictorum JCM 9942]